MRSTRYHLINAVMAAATLAAVIAVSSRVRGDAGTPEADVRREGRAVAEWQRYGEVGARMGAEQAPVTIVEFGDFTCPACRVAATRLSELRRRHPTTVAVVYRHLPLNDVSRQAAIAAECARRQDAFDRMHDLFYAQADSLGHKRWAAFAQQANVPDSVAFAQCMADTSTTSAAASVLRDVFAADSLFVATTPALLVNDSLYLGAPDLAGLEALVLRMAEQPR